jgi:hypothetical protein
VSLYAGIWKFEEWQQLFMREGCGQAASWQICREDATHNDAADTAAIFQNIMATARDSLSTSRSSVA